MRVAVLGAGLAGVSTAWFLARDGHDVAIVDRADGVASAASRANGGIIATSRAFPWPSPRMGATILRALVRNDQAVRVRLQSDPHFWRWSLRFLACCTQAQFERALVRKVALVRYSQALLGELVAATQIDYGRLGNGVLYLYRTNRELEQGVARLALMQGQGFRVQVLDAAAAVRVEPALAASAGRLAGAIHAETDEAGDAAAFCEALARLCVREGVRFHMRREIQGLDVQADRARAVMTNGGRIEADAFVCALGVIEPALRPAFAARLPVYPVKGYSLTVPVVTASAAPGHAGMDETKLIAFCPQGTNLRVTGGAEFTGYARDGTEADFRRLHEALEELFPGATDYAAAVKRVCQRPMTPDSLPRFGTARLRNVWFNIGQGHMGWAMAAGSARITADLLGGRAPAIDIGAMRIA